jgi:hypothetical protein
MAITSKPLPGFGFRRMATSGRNLILMAVRWKLLRLLPVRATRAEVYHATMYSMSLTDSRHQPTLRRSQTLRERGAESQGSPG